MYIYVCVCVRVCVCVCVCACFIEIYIYFCQIEQINIRQFGKKGKQKSGYISLFILYYQKELNSGF